MITPGLGSLLLALFLLASATAASLGHHAADAAALARELRALTHHQGASLRTSEVDHAALTALLTRAMKLESRPDDLWQRIPSEEFPNAPGIRVYDLLFTSMSVAARSAPSEREKERWLRQELSLIKRMLRAPRTRRVYSERRNEQDDTSDYVSVGRVANLDLPAVKDVLKRFCFLRPDEWTVVRGVEVIDEPGAVVVRQGRSFLPGSTLVRLGLPASKTPVATESLVHRGVVEVEIDEYQQIIFIKDARQGRAPE